MIQSMKVIGISLFGLLPVLLAVEIGEVAEHQLACGFAEFSTKPHPIFNGDYFVDGEKTSTLTPVLCTGGETERKPANLHVKQGTTVQIQVPTNGVIFDGVRFSIQAGASLTFAGTGGVTFRYNLLEELGAAMYNSFAEVVFEGPCTFKDNVATARLFNGANPSHPGYGIYHQASGGAIYNNHGKITFKAGATFSGNKATAISTDNRQVVYRASQGGAIVNEKGTILIEGDTLFENNSVQSSEVQGPYQGNRPTNNANGGAVYNTGEIIFAGTTTFRMNSATSPIALGGGIYNLGTVRMLKMGTFSENSVRGDQQHAGAVYIAPGAQAYCGTETAPLDECMTLADCAGGGVNTIYDGRVTEGKPDDTCILAKKAR